MAIAPEPLRNGGGGLVRAPTVRPGGRNELLSGHGGVATAPGALHNGGGGLVRAHTIRPGGRDRSKDGDDGREHRRTQQ